MSPGRAARRDWIGLAVLALPTLLLSLDLSVLYLALPRLTTDLGADTTQQLWITDIYGFMIAGFLVTMGTLGDRIGRRRLLMIGAAAFGIASLVAAFSTTPEMLIASRAILGVAGATLMPSTLALISNMFQDAKQRGVAIGVWMSCFMAGMAAGPVVGGLLLEAFWWGSVFLIGVPVMAVLLVAAPVLLPEYRDPGAGRLDLTSVALSLAAILPVIYGLKELAKHGMRPLPLLAMLAGAAFGVAFVRRQRRLTSPLLDLRLFGNRTFSAALAVMLLGTVTMGGIFLFVTQHLQLVNGLSPIRAGLLAMPAALAVLAGSLLAPVLVQRVRPGDIIAAGLAIMTVGLLLLTQVDGTGLPLLLTGYVLVSLGISPLGMLCTDMVVGAAPPERAGSAAALSETSGEFGIAFGVAAYGSLGTAVYRDELPDPGAFTSGLNAVAGVSAVIVVLFTILAVALLRNVRLENEAESPPDDVSGPALASAEARRA